jgi:cyclophilin family peptidyl-prolyl cis-trans isomerase
MSRISLIALWLALAAGRATAQEATPADQPVAEKSVDAATADAGEQPANETPAPSAEAVAARQAFDALHAQWLEVTKQLTALQEQRRAADGEAKAALDKQAADLYAQADALVSKITDAGLAVYKADPDAYPDVNNTLLFVAQFYLTGGGSTGDGGDQYEKAFELIKGLIDAGAGETWPHLYLWGAIAAYSTNQYDLAEQYFAKSDAAGGQDGGLSAHLIQLGAGYRENLPAMRKAWEKEAQFRAAEAKADDLPRVKFTTTKGDIVIELFENEAPQSVANFITLVKQGFYDGVVFHRVLPGFMAQGGDPQGTGMGGPGYNIRDEQRLPNARKHFRGSLSMANTGRPNTGGSQFFLTFVPTTYLDGRHAVFGRVIEGMENAASLKRGEPPRSPDKIVKAEVLRDRGHGYEFEKLPEQ